RLARPRRQGPARAHVPLDAHPDVRWRHQRDPARHHRGSRAGDAAAFALTPTELTQMEFSLTQEQQDIKSLAAKLFTDLAPPESLPDFEQPGDWFDEKLWKELARAQLLGVALP